MNYTDEAWEEEQMSNLGCKSVSDLIALAKGEQEKPIDTNTVRKVLEAYWEMQSQIYSEGMDLSDFSEEDKVAWVVELLEEGEEE